MKHIVLAVSYRAEMLEKEMKAQESKVLCLTTNTLLYCITSIKLIRNTVLYCIVLYYLHNIRNNVLYCIIRSIILFTYYLTGNYIFIP